MTKKSKIKKECRFCAFLESQIWDEREVFRCQVGKFDDKYGSVHFVWTGIWRPNQTVSAAQKDCPYFKVDPRVKLISRKGRS